MGTVAVGCRHMGLRCTIHACGAGSRNLLMQRLLLLLRHLLLLLLL